MGIKEDLFGKAPTPQVAQLDPVTQDLINKGAQRAERPVEDFSNEINQNVENYSKSLGQGPSENQQDIGLSGSREAQFQAIRNAYNNHAGTEINRLMNHNKYQAQMNRNQYTQNMIQAAMGQQRAQVANFEMLNQAYNQSEMARAQFVNSIFQSANTGIGMRAANAKGGRTSMVVGEPEISLTQADPIASGFGGSGSWGGYN